MLSKLSCYQFKIGYYNLKIFYISLIITPRGGKNHVVVIQKEYDKKSKYRE